MERSRPRAAIDSIKPHWRPLEFQGNLWNTDDLASSGVRNGEKIRHRVVFLFCFYNADAKGWKEKRKESEYQRWTEANANLDSKMLFQSSLFMPFHNIFERKSEPMSGVWVERNATFDFFRFFLFFFKKKRSEGNERQKENPSTTGSRLSTKKKAPKWVTEMTEPKKTRNKNDPSKKKTSLPPSFVFFFFLGFLYARPCSCCCYWNRFGGRWRKRNNIL